MFYNKPVALNKVTHKEVKVTPIDGDYSFAKKINSVIVAGIEFTEAAKEYPIVFAQAGDSFVPVALLGLRNQENLFVDDDGTWDARYIPAFVRRYPFVLASTPDAEQLVVCIDESYSGFNDSEGEALFSDDGEPVELLNKTMEFLEEYQRQYARTEAFLARLKENDLLMSLNARVDLVDGKQFSLTGLLAVDERKLLQLSDEKAVQLFRAGELAWIYCHLMSLGCMGRMVDRIAALELPETVAAVKKEKKEKKEKRAEKAKKTDKKAAKAQEPKKATKKSE
jgi:hypothetical protein